MYVLVAPLKISLNGAKTVLSIAWLNIAGSNRKHPYWKHHKLAWFVLCPREEGSTAADLTVQNIAGTIYRATEHQWHQWNEMSAQSLKDTPTQPQSVHPTEQLHSKTQFQLYCKGISVKNIGVQSPWLLIICISFGPEKALFIIILQCKQTNTLIKASVCI